MHLGGAKGLNREHERNLLNVSVLASVASHPLDCEPLWQVLPLLEEPLGV